MASSHWSQCGGDLAGRPAGDGAGSVRDPGENNSKQERQDKPIKTDCTNQEKKYVFNTEHCQPQSAETSAKFNFEINGPWCTFRNMT
jgi:hypothetical protein